MRIFGKLHDASSRALFLVAGAALALAVFLYLFEVTARYFFGAPTTWSGEVVQYCLSAIIFLALPEITRRQSHIVIDLVPAALSGRLAVLVNKVNGAVAGIACAMAGGIVALEAQKQFVRGLLTNAAHPIPRWWITAIIAAGLLSAATHFLRNLLTQREPAS